MTDQMVVKVGDVVAWDDVPNGAMVIETYLTHYYTVRASDGRGFIINAFGEALTNLMMWRPAEARAYVVALNLTGNETADELRALAEKFDREHPSA